MERVRETGKEREIVERARERDSGESEREIVEREIVERAGER